MKLSQISLVIFGVGLVNFAALHLGLELDAYYFMGNMFAALFLFFVGLIIEIKQDASGRKEE